MTRDFGQKHLPEHCNPISSLRIDTMGIKTSLVGKVALRADDGRGNKAGLLFPVGNVASGGLGVNTVEDDNVGCIEKVTLAKTGILFLACGVPNVEKNLAVVGVEENRVYLCTDGGLVDRLEGV